MATTKIRYAGAFAALASPLRVHFAPPLDTAPADDPVRRFVYAMAVCARDVDQGELPGPYADELAEAYARAFLMPDDEFASAAGEPDEALAARFGVPLEQIALKRADLTS
jgi:hypothetical protein